MNSAHIHLIVNHVPIILTIFSLFVLLAGYFTGKREYSKIAFVGFVIAAVFAIITFFTGEGAEDIVENIAGFSHDAIENHEHAAETARLFAIILGVFGLGGIFYFKDKEVKGYKVFMIITLILAIVASAYLIYTGYLGGLIRHTELTGV